MRRSTDESAVTGGGLKLMTPPVENRAESAWMDYGLPEQAVLSMTMKAFDGIEAGRLTQRRGEMELPVAPPGPYVTLHLSDRTRLTNRFVNRHDDEIAVRGDIGLYPQHEGGSQPGLNRSSQHRGFCERTVAAAENR